MWTKRSDPGIGKTDELQPSGSYMFKVNNRNTGTRCEICSKLAIKRDTPYLSVFSPHTGKYGPEKTPYLDTFHVVSVYRNSPNSTLVERGKIPLPLTHTPEQKHNHTFWFFSQSTLAVTMQFFDFQLLPISYVLEEFHVQVLIRW